LSRRDGEAGLLFIDFRAAFPSVLHGWIRLALLATGLPHLFVRAFSSLYIDVTAAIRFGNGAASSIPMLSGIRQGCPASGAIFAICIDPLLRRICSWLPSPWSRLVAYADDIAIALRGARRCLVGLFGLIDEAEACTGLSINVAKSTLVPLWTCDIAAATLEVQALSPRIASLDVAAFFKHLGVLVGPGANLTRWASVLAFFGPGYFREGRWGRPQRFSSHVWYSRCFHPSVFSAILLTTTGNSQDRGPGDCTHHQQPALCLPDLAWVRPNGAWASARLHTH
jgi:hypothetical protein